MCEALVSESTSYKCLSYYSNNKYDDKIWSHLGSIGKNIHNISLFCKKSYDTFKDSLYKELYKKLSCATNINVNEYIHKKVLYNHEQYAQINEHLKNNNNYIYKRIKYEMNLANVHITTNNVEQIINSYLWMLKKDPNIYFDNENCDILYTNIVTNIIFSFYRANYRTIKNCMLEHRPFPFYNQEIIDDINIGREMFILPIKIDYKTKIAKEFKYKIFTDQNFVGRLVYKKLDNNYGKIDSTMIGTIIEKIYKSYASFFATKKLNKLAQPPKFLYGDEKITLNYVGNKCRLNKQEQYINVHTSNYLGKNLHTIDNNYCKIATNKYIHKKHLCLLKPKKTTMKVCPQKKKETTMSIQKPKKSDPIKKNSYFYNEFYVYKDDKNIVDAKHIHVPYPTMLHDKEIKTIEIAFENGKIKYCVNYINKINIVKKTVLVESNDCISIDIGVNNLLTIYDPVDEQYIVPGKFLVSTNFKYSYLIGKAQKTNNKRKIEKFCNKRNNIINDYFNKIVKWLDHKYSHKKMIIIGYNKGWKNGANLGKKNNLTFNKIPYLLLLNKIKDKFKDKGIIIKLNEESYTSKCDALSNEPIKMQENYLGKRIKRGLFSSAKNKLINADINGAINIMRKVFINFINTCERIFNPIRINIFHEASCQWIMGNSTSIVKNRMVFNTKVY
jgi:IS605 OrfB family transposase